MSRTCRERVDAYIKENYAAQPEFLWQRDPDSCIYRRFDNRKWFAVIMVIDRKKLGLPGEGRVEILNVKLTDVLTAELVAQQEGFFKAYHMARGSWITVLLDGSVEAETIFPLIGESFDVTAPKPKKRRT